ERRPGDHGERHDGLFEHVRDSERLLHGGPKHLLEREPDQEQEQPAGATASDMPWTSGTDVRFHGELNRPTDVERIGTGGRKPTVRYLVRLGPQRTVRSGASG